MYLTLDQNISGDAVSEPQKMLESEKGGRLQAVSKESTKVSRRTPRKRVNAYSYFVYLHALGMGFSILMLRFFVSLLQKNNRW